MTAGLVPPATGADGAGSVRIPAAWCGVAGLKATDGRLPSADRTGLAAPGVLTRCVADAEAYWRARTGRAGTPGGRERDTPTALWSPDLGFADPGPEPVALAHAAARWLADAKAVHLLSGPSLVLEDPAPARLALRRPWPRRPGRPLLHRSHLGVQPQRASGAEPARGARPRRLPVGLQLVAGPGREGLLPAVAGSATC